MHINTELQLKYRESVTIHRQRNQCKLICLNWMQEPIFILIKSCNRSLKIATNGCNSLHSFTNCQWWTHVLNVSLFELHELHALNTVLLLIVNNMVDMMIFYDNSFTWYIAYSPKYSLYIVLTQECKRNFQPDQIRANDFQGNRMPPRQRWLPYSSLIPPNSML